jgi:hypothetical protein
MYDPKILLSGIYQEKWKQICTPKKPHVFMQALLIIAKK